MAGRFTWYELLTSDADAALAFYSQVVGWTGVDAQIPTHRYTLLKSGEATVAGIMGLSAENLPKAGPAWRGYVEVGDVDAMAQTVTTRGGAIYGPPTDIPNVGRFAVVADPQGASFMLYRGMPGEEGPEDAPGFVGWRELHAADIEVDLPWYKDLFGWTEDAPPMDMGEMGLYHLFSSGEGQQGGAMTSPDMPRPCWIYYFNVGDIDAAVARAKAAGAEILMGPHPVPDGRWILQARDPQGAMFALLGRKTG